MVTIVNFSHPLTVAQVKRIMELLGEDDHRVIEVVCHFNDTKPLMDQAQDVVKSALAPDEWAALDTVVVNPPGLAIGALAVLLCIRNWRGGKRVWLVRMRREQTKFGVAELIPGG